MSDSTDPTDADFEKANVRLNDGLKICRSVINNYRAMILDEKIAANDITQSGDAGRDDQSLRPNPGLSTE